MKSMIIPPLSQSVSDMHYTVYKGDLAEVVFGHESGCWARSANSAGHSSGSPQTFTFTSADSGEYSQLTFAGGISESPIQSGKLQYPEGMLVGSALTFHASGNFSADDYATSGQIFTIIGFTNASGASVLTINPNSNIPRHIRCWRQSVSAL